MERHVQQFVLSATRLSDTASSDSGNDTNSSQRLQVNDNLSLISNCLPPRCENLKSKKYAPLGIQNWVLSKLSANTFHCTNFIEEH